MTSLLLFVFCGFLEWVLYGIRLRLSVDGYALLAALIVVAEVMLGLWVYRQYSAGADLAGFCYAVGCGIGIYIGIKFKIK